MTQFSVFILSHLSSALPKKKKKTNQKSLSIICFCIFSTFVLLLAPSCRSNSVSLYLQIELKIIIKQQSYLYNNNNKMQNAFSIYFFFSRYRKLCYCTVILFFVDSVLNKIGAPRPRVTVNFITKKKKKQIINNCAKFSQLYNVKMNSTSCSVIIILLNLITFVGFYSTYSYVYV